MKVSYYDHDEDVMKVVVSESPMAAEIPDGLYGQWLDAKARVAQIEDDIRAACDAVYEREAARRAALTPRERRNEDYELAKRAHGLS